MIDGRCAGCKWWMHEPDTQSRFHMPSPPADPKWGICKLASWTWNGMPKPYANVKMSDRVGDAWLETHESFGCVRFEPLPGERHPMEDE